MIHLRSALLGLACALYIPAALPAQYPGHGCLKQGTLELCMAQLSSDVFYALMPDWLIDRTWRWHRFMVFVLSDDDSIEAFQVRLIYETDGKQVTITQAEGRRRDVRDSWTAVFFYAPPGARFVSIRVTSLRPLDVIEASRTP